MADDLNSSPGRGAGSPGSQSAAAALLKGAAKTIAALKKGTGKKK